jgi:hypothetical protein
MSEVPMAHPSDKRMHAAMPMRSTTVSALTPSQRPGPVLQQRREPAQLPLFPPPGSVRPR